MERKDCIVCGTSFPFTKHNRLTCSYRCSEIRHRDIRKASDAMARRALLEPPLYTKTQLAEAKHHIKLYDTPDKVRGREYVLIKAHQIVDYWRNRDAMEDRVIKLRERTKTSTAKYYWKKRNDERRNTVNLATQGQAAGK